MEYSHSSSFWSTFTIQYFGQYFGQNSGRPVRDGAIVTKGFVTGAGFVQAMPLGQVPRNSLKQMLVEGAPFETRHGKPYLAPTALLPRLQFAQGQSTHAGVEVKMQLGL